MGRARKRSFKGGEPGSRGAARVWADGTGRVWKRSFKGRRAGVLRWRREGLEEEFKGSGAQGLEEESRDGAKGLQEELQGRRAGVPR